MQVRGVVAVEESSSGCDESTMSDAFDVNVMIAACDETDVSDALHVNVTTSACEETAKKE